MRDLLIAGSWGTVPGMSKCGRVGDAVVAGVRGTGEVIVSVMGVVVPFAVVVLIAIGGPL